MKLSEDLKLYPVTDDLKPLTVYLAVGLDNSLVEQLVAKSRQPAMLEHTPKDAGSRFTSFEAFKSWNSDKPRELHWLLGKDNDLAGFMWYCRAELPLEVDLPEKPGETFAVRIYEGYSGHGLARPFLNMSLKVHLALQKERGEPPTGIWLETDVDNPAAVSAYTKFGYHEIYRTDKRVTMYMTAKELAAKAKE